MIRWRLKEVMRKHRIKSVELAKALPAGTNTISSLRSATTMPRMDGNRLNRLCEVLSQLSKLKEPITPNGLIEYVADDSLNLK